MSMPTAAVPNRSESRTTFPLTIWHAPLVPVALAATGGAVADRFLGIPLALSLLTAVCGLIAWAIVRSGKRPGLPLVYLWLSAAALAAAYHHCWRDVYAPDDIGAYATPTPQPVLLRGVLVEEPTIVSRPLNDPLQSIPRPDADLDADPTIAVIRVTALRQQEDWVPVTGRAELIVGCHWSGLHVGDEIEVSGRLVAPHGPANPGEEDYASRLRDRRIRALVVVRKTSQGIERLHEGWPRSVFGWLGALRGWGDRQLTEALPREQSHLAMALLLGEESAVSSRDWEKYRRTGVIHALAISGLHLVVLAFFLWWAVRLLGVRRSRGAWFVALFLLAYALLVGGRPPVMRAAIMVCIVCGGYVLRRPVLPANALALAWLVVGLLNPTAWFAGNCQVSFVAVVVLHWGMVRWFGRAPLDPLQRLIEESRPLWLRLLRRAGFVVAAAYAATALVSLALAPSMASWAHVVSPVGILIGPPVMLLTCVALVAGFFLLLAAAVCSPLVPVFAWVTARCLALSDHLVSLAAEAPGGHFYVPDVPGWWVVGYTAGLLALLLLEPVRRRWRWMIVTGLGWVCIGLLSGAARPASEELRCTFLAVGHGGCTVIETPDGRVLLYDAGAINGPDAVAWQLAPYLWSRGIRRIDEVFLSHADLDHFNGLLALLERFSVAQVTWTPTFHQKPTAGVRHTVATLEQRGVPVRVVHAPARLSYGDVELEVLHPPAQGPPGNENARSLVLLIRHAGHSILLTGDLADEGLERVVHTPPTPVDVLMAPHHGSKTANTPALADWARPRLVVSCQGAPTTATHGPDPGAYRERKAQFLGTWPHGAVTIRSQREGLFVETFQTGLSFRVSP